MTPEESAVPGFRISGEELAFHLVGEHKNAAALGNGPMENLFLHRDEHLGPGGIRNHPVHDFRYVPEVVEAVMEEAERTDGIPGAGCPDGGTCHHECRAACWRVQACGPLSGVYEGNEWPPEVKAANQLICP